MRPYHSLLNKLKIYIYIWSWISKCLNSVWFALLFMFCMAFIYICYSALYLSFSWPPSETKTWEMPCVPAIRPLSQPCTSMMRNLSDKLSRVFRNLTGTGFSAGKTENGLSLSARLSLCICPSRSQRARPLKQPPLRSKSNLEWNLSSILNTYWGERSSPGHHTSSTWISESRSPWHDHWHRQVQSGSDLFGTQSNTTVNPYRNKVNMQSKLAILSIFCPNKLLHAD